MKIAEGFLRLKKGKVVSPGRHTGWESDRETGYDGGAGYEGEAFADEQYGSDVGYGEDEDYTTEYWEDADYATDCDGDADYAPGCDGDAGYATGYDGDADYVTGYDGDADYATEYGEDEGYATQFGKAEDYAAEYEGNVEYEGGVGYGEDAEDVDEVHAMGMGYGVNADCGKKTCNKKESRKRKKARKKKERTDKGICGLKGENPGSCGEAETGEEPESRGETGTVEGPGFRGETGTGEGSESRGEAETGEEPESSVEAEKEEELEFCEMPESHGIAGTGEESGSHEGTEPAEKAGFNATSDGVPEETALPVMKVDNVTMKFKVATGSTSGLKDYVIQKIKKQITTRDLLALDGVNFEVYKGEVVGVIGTNGSGKSTLLKIISGALKPTSGQVIVDQSKIQLLTLGTGFDMELTAKENVYLNGAIIGYSREFIDKHYEEIVAFAELEGFMDTKVKNFSSGMVSRLGFAIATAGDAAEILILDEVLSVGDEFFRKKSLKRVKEMIHGGSTVIMVSHGMGTIRENCTKVVWIEKGVLQMVGDAKTVCRAYQRMERTVAVDN